MPLTSLPGGASRSKVASLRFTPREWDVLEREAAGLRIPPTTLCVRVVQEFIARLESEEMGLDVASEDFPPLTRSDLVEVLQAQLRHVSGQLDLLREDRLHAGEMVE